MQPIFSGPQLTKNFVLTLGIGITFGFGFAYMVLNVSKYNGAEFVDMRSVALKLFGLISKRCILIKSTAPTLLENKGRLTLAPIKVSKPATGPSTPLVWGILKLSLLHHGR